MSSFWKMQYASTAMQVVVQEHAPAEMQAQLERQKEEIERLRMQVEDLRQAQISPHREMFSRSRQLTWREVGQMQHAHVEMLHSEVIEPAVDMLEASRSHIRTLLGTPAWSEALEQTHNTICDAEQRLRDEDDQDMAEESEEGEMEEE